MTTFYRPKLYDETLAEEGIWHKVERNGTDFGTYLLRYFDTASMEVSRELAIYHKREAKRLKVASLDDIQTLRVTLCDHIILDWKGIDGADGKPVDFSPEVAKEWFDERYNFVMLELINEARDSANYPNDDALEAVEAPKN